MTSSQPKASASPPDAHLFQRANVEKSCVRDGENLSIFDYTLKTALLFSQGDWSLIVKDLTLAGVSDECIAELEESSCSELIRAFRIRREIIHYKKVCLHLFEEARRIEKELKQCMSFFFWNDGIDKDAGSAVHLQAIFTLLTDDWENGIEAPWNIDAVKIAMENHNMKNGDGSESQCSLFDRKVMFVLASSGWMYHKGVMKAINDARDIAKAICMSPRHPDGEANGERPRCLQSLPYSMKVVQHIKKDIGEDNEKNMNTSCAIKPKGMEALERILSKVRHELNWPDEGVDFLSRSICARGGFKAMAMVEELKTYCQSIQQVPLRLQNLLHLHLDSQISMSKAYDFGSCNIKEDLSIAVSRHKEILHIHGMLKAMNENKKWVDVLAQLDADDCSATRLFVAGDDASSYQSSAFVPKDFMLGNFVKSSRKLLETILIPTMRATSTIESWPPPAESSRNRVLAFREESLQNAKINRKKLLKCNECSGYFDSRWTRNGTCSICEYTIREKSPGEKCFFVNCKAGTEAFCKHHQRCFICDAPHSCGECRMYRGNGELSTSLVETLRPHLLLLDFDRTLCSTKSGANPLPKRTTAKQTKESYSHSIDEDLKIAIYTQQGYGQSHVITRNSHKAEIQDFLRMHGLHALSKKVHIVPKKMTKGAFIKEMFRDQSQTMLFLDDNINELTADEWLRSSPNVTRQLFLRGFVH